MIRFLTDENFNVVIVRALQRLWPSLDIISVRQAGLTAQPDEAVLAWAAAENRLLLTHDKRTMETIFYERMAQNLPVTGVLFMEWEDDPGRSIAELSIIIEVDDRSDFDGKFTWMPLWP